MRKLKLTVNEEKTRICKVPEGEFVPRSGLGRHRPADGRQARLDEAGWAASREG
jgi:hypothetical protein